MSSAATGIAKLDLTLPESVAETVPGPAPEGAGLTRQARRNGHRRLPSVRLLITLIVVLPLSVLSATLVSIAVLTSRSIAENLGDEIVNRWTERVISDVRTYLSSAMRVSDSYARRVHDGDLHPNNLSGWEQPMFRDLATNPDVASICFTTLNADCTWLLHAHGRLELGLVAGNNRDHAVEYAATPDGTVDRSKVLRDYHYDATERPWYETAMRQPSGTWTPIYSWFGETGPASTTGTGYVRTIEDASGQVVGVLIIDVTLGALSEHLQQMHLGKPGWTFLIDETGKLVAASEGAVNSDQGERLSPGQSDSPAARAIAHLISSTPLDAYEADQTERVTIGDVTARARVTDVDSGYPGIHWHVVTVLPEASFLNKVTSLQNRAVLMTFGAITGGLAIGLLLSRRLSRPLVDLTNHVARVGAGDFDSRLNLGHASELQRLSDEVNRMAGGLKHRMMLQQSMAVATQVQQSLLPSQFPAPDGLEIAACSRYCESTGGDYFDFIDVADLAGKQTLIAVGDVTGHGIGAALLMATVRGAVRASTPAAPSLGHIMSRANQVLAGHTKNGMFMTLALLRIDPQTRRVRWSTAGHDPALVYHPESDSFEELGGGDVPLGIETDVRYVEQSRRCATPGALFLVGTDGIWEARNGSGEMFGKDRLRDLLRGHSTSAHELAEAIKQAIYSWVGNAPLRDDVTFVVARISK